MGVLRVVAVVRGFQLCITSSVEASPQHIGSSASYTVEKLDEGCGLYLFGGTFQGICRVFPPQMEEVPRKSY